MKNVLKKAYFFISNPLAKGYIRRYLLNLLICSSIVLARRRQKEMLQSILIHEIFENLRDFPEFLTGSSEILL